MVEVHVFFRVVLEQWACSMLWLSSVNGGCRYDRQRCEAKQIKDMQLKAAMAPPGGGRNAFSQRLQVSQLTDAFSKCSFDALTPLVLLQPRSSMCKPTWIAQGQQSSNEPALHMTSMQSGPYSSQTHCHTVNADNF